MQPTLSDRVRFGSFELDPRGGELRGNGETVVLPEQQFQILRMLIDHAGVIVTREEIKKRGVDGTSDRVGRTIRVRDVRCHMKTIGYLGQIDKLFGVPVTTRNWNTIAAVVRVLKTPPR